MFCAMSPGTLAQTQKLTIQCCGVPLRDQMSTAVSSFTTDSNQYHYINRYQSIDLIAEGRNDKAEQLGIDTWWNSKLMLSQASIILEYISASKEVFEYFRPSTIIKTLHNPFNKSLDSIKIHRPNIRQTLSDVLASKNWSKTYVEQECDKNGKQQTRQDKCFC